MSDKEEPHINIAGFDLNQREVQALGAAAVAASFAAKQRRDAIAREEAARKAEIARQEAIRKEDIRREEAKEAQERQEFDDQNDPCPYCHTQIPKEAALCPSCRNGFFGIPWDLINEAVVADPTVVEGLTSEKLSAAVEKVKPAYEARLAREEQERIAAKKQAEEKARQLAELEAKRKQEQARLAEIEREKAAERTKKRIKSTFILLAIIGAMYLAKQVYVFIVPPTPDVLVQVNEGTWPEEIPLNLPYNRNAYVSIVSPSNGTLSIQSTGTGCQVTGHRIKALSGVGDCKITIDIGKSSSPKFAATQLVRDIVLIEARPSPPKTFLRIRLGSKHKLPIYSQTGTKRVKWIWKSTNPKICKVKYNKVFGKHRGGCRLVARTSGVRNYLADANGRGYVHVVK